MKQKPKPPSSDLQMSKLSSKPSYIFESSDDEQEDYTTPERAISYAMNFKLKHGKAFRGKSLQEVSSTARGRSYLRWSLDEFDGLHEAARKNIKLVLQFYASTKAAKSEKGE